MWNAIVFPLNLYNFRFLNFAYAFGLVSRSYPVIVLLENHCSISQQRLLAKQIQSIFGDALYVPCLSQTGGECDATPQQQQQERVRNECLVSERAQVNRTSPSLSSTSSDDAEQQQQQQQQQPSQQRQQSVNHGIIDCQGENNSKQQQQSRQVSSSFRGQTSTASSTSVGSISSSTKFTQLQQQLDIVWSTVTPAQLKHRIILSVSN